MGISNLISNLYLSGTLARALIQKLTDRFPPVLCKSGLSACGLFCSFGVG
jgi:hypothetical protein